MRESRAQDVVVQGVVLEGKPGRDASARKAPPAAAQVEWTSRLLPHLSASERQNHNAWRRAFEVFPDLAFVKNRSISDKQNVISSAIRQARPRHVSLSYAELCLPSVKKLLGRSGDPLVLSLHLASSVSPRARSSNKDVIAALRTIAYN